MTGFKLERYPFGKNEIRAWSSTEPKYRNWPVVYVLNNDTEVYVGETLNVESRMRQHLDSKEKKNLNWVRVVLDDTFNKSACLDLESFLIRMFSGDGNLKVLNHNAGITDADYYDRETYKKTFDEVFEQLRTNEQLFKRTVPEIINSDLFKLSPFKALNHDQAVAVEDILEVLFHDLDKQVSSTVIVKGGPGTGKTVVAIYLMKLLEDIKRHDPEEPVDGDTLFSDFFTPGYPELLKNLRIGLVVPQQSLRKSIAKVFKLTPGLNKSMVMTPFDAGESDEPFDVLIVDEAHRLNQRANQPAAILNRKFKGINIKLFGEDNLNLTQLDWLKKQSKHVILMLDTGQSVRTADLPAEVTNELLKQAAQESRIHPLQSQMRVTAGQDYVEYIRKMLSDNPPEQLERFEGYDLRLFTDLGEMRRELRKREEEYGLSRLVAGYAWPWKSNTDPDAYDIEIDGERMRWNRTTTDWINSPGAIDEVGSIHTVQGYDLNYVGVIIGNDLKLNESTGKIEFDRSQHFDKKGIQNNPKLGIKYTDDELLQLVQNIYTVLLTRGIRGTYVYACDPIIQTKLRYLV